MPPSSSSIAASAIRFTEETVLATLTSYANDWARALDFYNYVSAPPYSFSHTPATLAAAVDILGKHLEFPLAFSLLGSSSAPSPSAAAFRCLFNRLAAARLVDDALHAFNHHAKLFHLHTLPTYHLLVDALCDHRLVAEAELLCLKSQTPPFPADTKIYNMILRGWLKVQHYSKCRNFWEEMDRKGIKKDLHTYTIYMDVLSKSGKPWKAIKLYKEMKRSKWVLDVVVYNTVIQAAGLAEGPDRAVRVLREMMDEGCQPNVASFNTVIKMLCREGRVREGYSFLHQMRKKECEPNVITYHCFFQYCTRPNEILWLFERMVESGCRPRMDTYVMLMKKFGRWGFLRPVFMVWKAMEEHGVSPDAFAYNAMIDALLQKGMVELARKYDEEMLEKGLSAKPRKEFGTKYLNEEHDDDDNAFSGVF